MIKNLYNLYQYFSSKEIFSSKEHFFEKTKIYFN